MTEEAKTRPTTRRFPRMLAGTGFIEMQYWIYVAKEKFHSEKFSEEVKGLHSITWPKHPQQGEFHVNAHWGLDDDGEMGFGIEYEMGPAEDAIDEHEPYAEQFMEWLGQFFKSDSAEGHEHARFRYALASRESKFPLPLKTALEGNAEIDGISVRLPMTPNGVSNVRLTRSSKYWFVETIANRRIAFKEHSIYNDVQAFMSVIDTLLEEKR